MGARMFGRPSLLIAASSLSILAGCGGAPPVESRPLPSAPPRLSEQNESNPAPLATKPAEGPLPCAPRHAISLRPIHPGRGDRVVLAKSEHQSLAFVANEDDAAIHTIDLDKHDEIAITQLPGSP